MTSDVYVNHDIVFNRKLITTLCARYSLGAMLPYGLPSKINSQIMQNRYLHVKKSKGTIPHRDAPKRKPIQKNQYERPVVPYALCYDSYTK